jgi:soluble lytic murein transglycosylase
MSRGGSPRFWVWFRAVPIVAMAIVLALSLAVSVAPRAILRAVLCPVDYGDYIVQSSERHGVDSYLVCAIIRCESGWDATTTSSAGAVGLMQVMPSTAETLAEMGYVDSSTYDPNNLTDPATNIEYGCAYLSYLQQNLSSEEEVIAAYNAGISKVLEWSSGGGDISEAIDYPETAAYLERVKAARAQYEYCYPDGINA